MHNAAALHRSVCYLAHLDKGQATGCHHMAGSAESGARIPAGGAECQVGGLTHSCKPLSAPSPARVRAVCTGCALAQQINAIQHCCRRHARPCGAGAMLALCRCSGCCSTVPGPGRYSRTCGSSLPSGGLCSKCLYYQQVSRHGLLCLSCTALKPSCGWVTE